MVGTLLLPYLLRKLDDEHYDFVDSHTSGAIAYQALGLLVFGISGGFLAHFWSPTTGFERQLLVGFFFVIWLLAVLIYVLGAVVFSMQAWSGKPFDFPLLNGWIYGKP